MELTTSVVVARYKKNSPTSGLESRDGKVRNFFSSSKASWHSFVHVKSCFFLRTLKKGRQRSADLDMN